MTNDRTSAFFAALGGFLGVAGPICLGGAGVIFSYLQNQQARQEKCVEMIYKFGENLNAKSSEANYPLLYVIFNKIANDLKCIDPDYAEYLLAGKVGHEEAANARNGGRNVNGVPVPTAQPITPPPPQQQPSVPANAANDAPRTPVRLFVHIGREESRQKAQMLVDAIGGNDVPTLSVLVPGIENVGNIAPARPQLRFLKKADEAAARTLAKAIAGTLKMEVDLVDLSARFDAAPNVRRGTLEFWMR